MLNFAYRKLLPGVFTAAVVSLLLRVTAAVAQYKLITFVANEKDLGHEIPQAFHIDRHIQNAWGLANLPDGPFWVTDEYTGYATVYGADGTIHPFVVTVPPSPGDPLPPGCPTGIVANPWGGFTISENGKSGSALFLFVTLDGTISGWNPGVDPTKAVMAVDNSSLPAVYTGLDITHNWPTVSASRTLSRRRLSVPPERVNLNSCHCQCLPNAGAQGSLRSLNRFLGT